MSRKPYVRPISKTSWFLANAQYQSYMAREVTCIVIAIYLIILIVGLFRLSEGPAAWAGWLDGVTGPLGALFHIIAFFVFLFHTASWFNVTPKAMRIQKGEDFVPGPVIVGAHYAAWAAVTVFVLILAGVA